MPRLFSVFHIDDSVNLRWLLVVQLLKELQDKLIGFYLPIYLFTLGSQRAVVAGISGQPVEQGLLTVAAYFLLMRFSVVVSSMTVGKVIHSWGTRLSLTLGLLLQLGNILLLSSLVDHWWLLPILAAMTGVHVSFFWQSYHPILAKFARRRFMGEDLSVLKISQKLIGILGPLVGGLVVVTEGFSNLFLLGGVITLLSIISAWQIQNQKFSAAPSWTQLRHWLSEARFWQVILAVSGQYLDTAGITLWSVFLLLILGNLERVGLVYAVTMVVSVVVTGLSGYLFDRRQTKAPFLISGLILAVTWLLRVPVSQLWQVLVLDSLEKVVASWHWLVFDARLLSRGKGRSALAFFVYREIMMSSLAVGYWSVIVGMLIFTSMNWTVVFGLAMIGVVASLFIKDHA